MPSDEALLEQLLAGDVGAFDALYARYERPLFGFILREVDARDVAEDVLHETFLALLRDKASVQRARSLRAWLFQVARNLCLNRHRSRRREERAMAAEAEAAEVSADSPEVSLAGAQQVTALRTAVTRLPRELAELYQLRTRGLSYEEIASVLAIPVGTVKSRMHQVVSRLREELPT